MNQAKFIGTTTKGRLSCRESIATLLRGLPDGMELQITIEEYKPTRSIPQNRYYMGPLLKYALKYYENNVADLLQDVLKAIKFQITTEFIHILFKMLYNNGKSTRKLTTEGMNDYCDAIRQHFLMDFKYDVPPPNEEQIDLENSS